MTALHALGSARAIGIHVSIDSEDLVLEAPKRPSQAFLDLLFRHKAQILKALTPAADGWSPEDWQVFFEARAAVAEMDGALPRPEAEMQAFACCLAEWLNRNPAVSGVCRCAACGVGDQRCDLLVPFGAEARERTWLHRACWPAWCGAREAEAIAALSLMGIRRRENCYQHQDERNKQDAEKI